MAPRTQYGKKAGTYSTAAAQIFGIDSSNDGERKPFLRAPLSDLTKAVSNLKIDALDESIAVQVEAKQQPRRKARKAPISDSDDIRIFADRKPRLSTSLPGTLNPTKQNAYTVDAPTSDASIGYEYVEDHIGPVLHLENSANYSLGSNRQNDHVYPSLPPDDPLYAELKPLMVSYEEDCGMAMSILSWEDIFPEDVDVKKEAEATYSEVYEASLRYGESSMFKVIRIQTTTDPESLDIVNASTIAQITSEIRIMNTMTTVPGFVVFKGANIVRGECSEKLIEAYKRFDKMQIEAANDCSLEPGSQFPDPTTYSENTVCLVIELSNGGQALEKLQVIHPSQIWDVLLGVVMTLARGESANEFEHRDLHENNIVFTQNHPNEDLHDNEGNDFVVDAEGCQKLGKAGIIVTVIDYGLSRATMATGEVVAFDFETDKAIFCGTPENSPQFKSYRAMRTHLLTGKRKAKPIPWHTNNKNDDSTKSWETFTPYTNVVWLKYLLTKLRESHQLFGPTSTYSNTFMADKKEFNIEISEFERLLGDRSGGFESALQALEYTVVKGWIAGSHLDCLDESLLSQGLMLEEDSSLRDE